MPFVIGIALFGSRARSDHSDNSDVDLLLWTSDGYPQHVRQGLLSLSFYARPDLLEKAEAGDLFAGHLAHEAVPVCDPLGLLNELRSTFRPKPSYWQTARDAEDLGYFLIENTPLIEPSLLNRRIAWVVRTILMAKAIERSIHSFAPTVLAQGLGAHDVFPLIAAKDYEDFSQERIELFEQFLQKWGKRGGPPAESIDYEALFRANGNSFGLKTLRAVSEATSHDLYT